jgi:hypothetical protein
MRAIHPRAGWPGRPVVRSRSGRDERGRGRLADPAAVEHAAQRRDDLGVELRAGVPAQLRDRELPARRLAVRPVGVIASKASATRMMRDSSGMAPPARPSG